MRYRKLDANLDYSFGNGLNDFYIDIPEAPGQAVQTRLLLFLGEWFYNISDGTPYMTSILGKHSKEKADVTIQDRVINTQGVTDLTNYQSVVDPENRFMQVLQMEVDTVYGPTLVDLQNYANY